MKNNKEKYFDTVQMVREIRNAIFRQSTDPDFDNKEFKRIKEKWTKLLKLQEKSEQNKIELARFFLLYSFESKRILAEYCRNGVRNISCCSEIVKLKF